MWLGIDTASDRAAVALGDPAAAGDAGTIDEETVLGARRHAAALLPMVQRLLQRAGITAHGITGVALSDGPGSFTGLRVGAAMAKALVRVRAVPLWTAPSLLVRAAGVIGAAEIGPVLAATNALRGDIYAAMYRFRAGAIETLLEPQVWQPAALIDRVARPALVVADLPAPLEALLAEWSGRPVVGLPEAYPSAAVLLRLVGRPGGAREIADPLGWEPVYGRPAEAQARWETAHGRPLPDPAGHLG